MPTTTIRIPEALKARIAQAAEGAGITPHAFIVQAIENGAAEAEAQAELHEMAQARWDEFKRTGEAVSPDAMRRYVRGLAAGKKPAAPRARKVLR